MSSISPEFRTVPGLIEQLGSGYVLPNILADILLQRNSPRDFLDDAGRIALQNEVIVDGLENIPRSGGVLLVFNHPYLTTLLPALMNLAVGINNEIGRKDFTLVMASEFRLSGNHDDRHLPGSPAFFRGFGKLYPENIILVPQKKSRRDYDSGRVNAGTNIIRALLNGRIVAISPEGQIEKDGVVLDVHEYQSGAGKIAKWAIKKAMFIVPIGIWKDQVEELHTKIGQPLKIQSKNDQEVLREIMSEVQSLISN